MELRTTREMRRNAQLDKVMLKKTDAPAKAQTSQPKEPADKFSLSQQALAYVDEQNLEYLMKNDPDGYRMALALRRENPDPKDEKSVLDDEDKNGGAEESGGEAEAPQVSAPEASSGGGEASSGGGEASSPAE